MKLWHIAVLLVAGIGVGIALPARLTGVFGTATLYVFLPALIFEAAWHLDLRVMRRKWKPIAILAVPGVALTALIVAIGTHYAGALAWGPALLLGAILSATDPIAVVAIFRRLKIPEELSTIVQSESLLNDAVAVVLYRATLAVIVLAGGVAHLGPQAGRAVLGVILGSVAGGIFAWVAAFALRDRVSGAVQCAGTFIGAYGVYALAEHFGWPGIFAVIVFGITLRELERRSVSIASAQAVDVFWQWAALIANCILFFLIGAALDLTRLRYTLAVDGAALICVLVARSLLAYGLLRLAREALAPFWSTVIRMAGIRGALALALALATPMSMPQRGLVINATFAVVVATVLLGALTLRARMERLPLD